MQTEIHDLKKVLAMVKEEKSKIHHLATGLLRDSKGKPSIPFFTPISYINFFPKNIFQNL